MPSAGLDPDAPLSLAYLTYRGKPHVGGQGVYTRHLTKALRRPRTLGRGVRWAAVPGARRPGRRSPSSRRSTSSTTTTPVDSLRTGSSRPATTSSRRPCSATGQFPEPLAFSARVNAHLSGPARRVRSRPRQPVPRLRHRQARREDPPDRHAPPPDHPRSDARDGSRPEPVQAVLDRPLVRLREDAGQGRVEDCPVSSW